MQTIKGYKMILILGIPEIIFQVWIFMGHGQNMFFQGQTVAIFIFGRRKLENLLIHRYFII